MLPQTAACVTLTDMKTRTWKRAAVLGLLLLALLAAAVWSQRVLILQYSVGWITDWRNPRAPNRPVPWQPGPTARSASSAPNLILIVAHDLGLNDSGPLRTAPPGGETSPPTRPTTRSAPG